MFVDTAGNLHVDMREFNKRGKTTNTTLFVAHVDTVHRQGGTNVFDDSTAMWKAGGGQPLGADDGAGVAVLSALIRHGKPAYYIFTRGEESGGVGSKHLAEAYEDLLQQFDRAIAFDRKDVFSVITHQGWSGRCCSEMFAEALCAGLNGLGMMMMPDDGGVYTDTAEFVDFIPECTNISAGYYREHTKDECLDTDYLRQLCDAAIALDWDTLPTVRSIWGDDEDDDIEYEFETIDDEHPLDRYPKEVATIGHKPKAKAHKPAPQQRLPLNPLDVARKALAKASTPTLESAQDYADRQAAADKADIAETLARWDAQDARDAARERDTRGTARADAVRPDDPFAWSEDGKTLHTGSRKH